MAHLGEYRTQGTTHGMILDEFRLDGKVAAPGVGRGLLAAALVCFLAGCTSQRERRLEAHRKTHERIRTSPGEPVGKWEPETKE